MRIFATPTAEGRQIAATREGIAFFYIDKSEEIYDGGPEHYEGLLKDLRIGAAFGDDQDALFGLELRNEIFRFRPTVLHVGEAIPDDRKRKVRGLLREKNQDVPWMEVFHHRLNFIMREIEKWLKKNHCELAWWAGVPHFQTMMRAVEVCYGESDSPRFWREQGSFLVSEEGQAYIENLEAERKKLYKENETVSLGAFPQCD